MKKTFLFLLVIFITTLTFAQPNTAAFNIQGGYSWTNGVIGAELQAGYFAVSAGYFPTKMPVSGEAAPSFSSNFLLYTGKWNENSFYASIGVASAGYRNDDIISPMTIAMVGYKITLQNLNMKLGGGYGWCSYDKSLKLELTLGWAIPIW
jgi:hypothetical protein